MGDAAVPDATDARRIVTDALGTAPSGIGRFTTGSHHYVFDVAFADHPPVVARIARPSERGAMMGALELSNFLRPRGVRLPEILASDVHASFPWLLLERLDGSDLGESIGTLPASTLDAIAGSVVEAQAMTAGTPSAGRYGYAVRPEDAPYARWSEVLEAHLHRSRRRMTTGGYFDLGLAEVAWNHLNALRGRLDLIPATAFLHDTTTKNVIVTSDGRFSGIVDVDDLCFGDPRYPAALTLAALMAHVGPTDYVAAWQQHAGWPDDRLFRLYVALFLLDLMGEHGQIFNGNERPSQPNERAALLDAFEATLDEIEQRP